MRSDRSLTHIIDEIERISANLHIDSDLDIPTEQERLLFQRICGSLHDRIDSLKKGPQDDLAA